MKKTPSRKNVQNSRALIWRLILLSFVNGACIGIAVILFTSGVLNTTYTIVAFFLLAILASNAFAKIVLYAHELSPRQV